MVTQNNFVILCHCRQDTDRTTITIACHCNRPRLYSTDEPIHPLEEACDEEREPRDEEEDIERVEADSTCKIKIWINDMD